MIACSGTKRDGGRPWLAQPETFADLLPAAERQRLLFARRYLAKQLGIVAGPDVGGDSTAGAYLPAHERYAGKTYAGIGEHLWPHQGSHQLLIISALYGAIFSWELIQSYDLEMGQSLGNRRRACSFWRENGLPGWLARFFSCEQPSCVVDLLSSDYRKAVRGYRAEDTLVSRFEYPGRGTGSLYDRALHLSALLSKIQEAP